MMQDTLYVKYGKYLSKKDVAYELNISIVRLDTYKEFNQIKQGRKYPANDFINFLQLKTIHIHSPKEKCDYKKIRTIYRWLYMKYERLTIKMTEFLELINQMKVKFNQYQLNYRIKHKKGIPSYVKYHLIRFDMYELAEYLSHQEWFSIPESNKK